MAGQSVCCRGKEEAMNLEERRERLLAVLLVEKRRLWGEVRRELFEELGEGIGEQYDLPRDTGDRGLMDLLADLELGVSDTRRQQITALDGAMARLEAGTYGFCEECGADIPAERLKVEPFAPCCVACQARREGPGHPPGKTI
jgi:DnaK suppressor protein